MNQESKSIITAIIASVLTALIIIIISLGFVVQNRARVAAFLLGNNSGTNNTVVTTSNGDVSVVSAVKKANPAVVSIIISKNEPVATSPFDFFLPSQNQQNGNQLQVVGGGSGFLISADGLIATNAHVVDDATALYTVYTNDGKKHSAKVVAKDATQDIAVIKIDGSGYPFLNFGDSQNIALGQTAIAIGNALGEYRNTVSVGVISGLSRTITAGDFTGNSEQLDEVIQTDAAINPGNSGGPLLDANSNVIGMNVAVAEGSQSIGFALPSNTVKSAVDSVKAKGYISRPYIGIRYVPVTADIAQQKNLSVDYGMYVVGGNTSAEPAVIPNSPAAKAGIVEGDIILSFDGVKLADGQSLSDLVFKKKPGDVVGVTILHQGKQKTVSLTIGEYNTQK